MRFIYLQNHRCISINLINKPTYIGVVHQPFDSLSPGTTESTEKGARGSGQTLDKNRWTTVTAQARRGSVTRNSRGWESCRRWTWTFKAGRIAGAATAAPCAAAEVCLLRYISFLQITCSCPTLRALVVTKGGSTTLIAGRDSMIILNWVVHIWWRTFKWNLLLISECSLDYHQLDLI